MNADTIEAWMTQNIAEALQCPEASLDRELPLTALGLDSVSILGLAGELAEFTQQDIQVSLVWEYPTIASLSAQLATLVAEQSTPQNSTDIALQDAPLSFSQERVWRYANHSDDGDHNLVNESWILRGPLVRDAFFDSLTDLVTRHAILRTSFSVIDGIPLQSVRPEVTPPVTEYDYSEVADPIAQAEQMLEQLKQQSVSLRGQELFQVHLFKINDLEHRILFRLHHLIYDATSLGIFYQELRLNYNARQKGDAIPAHPKSLPVIEFAQRQRQRLAKDSENYQKMESWWQQRWTQEPFPQRLKHLPKVPKHTQVVTVASQSAFTEALPSALIKAVQDRAKANGVTEYMVYFGGFIALLHAYGHRSPFTIGSYFSDRSDPAVRNTIGFFINLLALRIETEGRVDGRSVIETSRRALSDSTIHQEFPFELLAETLESSGRKRPRIDVIFQKIPSLMNALQLEHLETIRWGDLNAFRNVWGMTVDILETGNTRSVRIRFDSKRYIASRVERMLHDYMKILEQIATQPDQRISKVKRFWLF